MGPYGIRHIRSISVRPRYSVISGMFCPSVRVPENDQLCYALRAASFLPWRSLLGRQDRHGTHTHLLSHPSRGDGLNRSFSCWHKTPPLFK